MAKQVLHKNETRGLANHGWLLSRHTFSFANYFNEERINFGALRVLNDDIVKPAMGFGTHPHSNMEIVSIPLRGALEHKDSTGNTKVIHTGEVQIMSAGSGLYHSEYNHSKNEDVNFLQIWVMPKEKNIKPQYDQRDFDLAKNENRLLNVVAPDNENALWINQDAWFSLGNFTEDGTVHYELKRSGGGVYVFMIEGSGEVNNTPLERRDGLGIYDTHEINIRFNEDSKVLLMEIPMNFS